MPQTILVINSGSSSIKYQLVDPSIGVAMASGLVERIGEEMSTVHHRYSLKEVTINEPIPNHEAALAQVLDLFEEVGPPLEEAQIVGIGHRIVQGGRYFSGPTLIDDRVKRLIGELSSLAPLHNPPALKGIEVCQKLLPGIPNIAVFDTAFFQNLPNSSALYALDRDVAERYSIRRYGAHGTSHQYVSNRVTQVLGDKELRQIVLHLGNGASASAIVAGRAVDTSMGLTPLEGLVMGTRTGDIDPAVVFHLQRVAGKSVAEVDNLFNKKSGLRGLAGDNDMRAGREMARAGNPRAREALEIYINRLVKYIGGYAAEMGGVDVITFTAGIGENDIDLRREVCERLSFFGVILDDEANNSRPREATTISQRDSSVRIMVVPTNEELAIANQSMTLV